MSGIIAATAIVLLGSGSDAVQTLCHSHLDVIHNINPISFLSERGIRMYLS